VDTFAISTGVGWQKYLNTFHDMLLPNLCVGTFTMQQEIQGGIVTNTYVNHENIDMEYIASLLSDLIYEIILPQQCAEKMKDRYDFAGIPLDSLPLERAFFKLIQPSIEEFEHTGKEILSFLKESVIFAVDGFVRFNMRDIYKNSILMSEFVMHHYMLEQEYQSFVYFLRMLAEEQISSIGEVLISTDAQKHYVLIDQKEGLPLSFSELTAADMPESENDRLLSQLLSLSPEHILIDHTMDRNAPIITTICNVFPERIGFY